MLNKILTSVIIFLTPFISLSLPAQGTSADSIPPSTIPTQRIGNEISWSIPKSPIDSIGQIYLRKLSQLSKQFETYQYTQADTLANPYYFYIFAQPTYYSHPVRIAIGKLPQEQKNKDEYILPPLLPAEPVTPVSLISAISNALNDIYTTEPQCITQEEKFLAVDGIREDVNKEIKPNVNLTEKIETTLKDNNAIDDFDFGDWKITVRRPNFWTFSNEFTFEIMQVHISDNWYKGGESNYSWSASAIINANYNNKRKITFDNKLEMNLGFRSSKDDDKHKFLTHSDLIRLTNKLGLKATEHWYYTLTLQSWTQFYPSYKKNDPKVYSDFMSPFESVPSLGMDYRLSVKNFTLDASISPFSGRFKYVDRLALSPAFGVKAGKHTDFSFGSNITINYTWNMFKNISWGSRIFYYTNYDMTNIEWENTFNLKINEFLTTKFFIFPRFDDSVQKKAGSSYFQLYETLSLKFNVKF